MKTTISILGLYNFDNTLFDNMVLPRGVDRETVINNMLLELAELEVLYSNFDVLKMSIGMWSKKELPVWEKLYATTQFEYDPISNYDRTEEWTEKETRDLKSTQNEQRSTTNTYEQTRDLKATNTFERSEVNTGNDTTITNVVGFNSEAETLKDKATVQHGLSVKHNNSETGTDNGTVKDSGSGSGTISNNGSDTGTVDNIRTGRAYGNIGVTTTQQMIEAEREVVKFNVTDYIIESFKNRFCILIY